MKLATGFQIAGRDPVAFWDLKFKSLRGEEYRSYGRVRESIALREYAEQSGWSDAQMMLAIHRYIDFNSGGDIDGFIRAMGRADKRDELIDPYDLVAEALCYLEVDEQDPSPRALAAMPRLQEAVNAVTDYRAAWGPDAAKLPAAMDELTAAIAVMRDARR